ncbi:MAG TPA: translocation/assembly module TamB domain-containing protein [Chitinispirillaceae bacterium]|nr:translocation/assembly module TamB domain-containing protein [Chitinispirillaceae bacterium]
MKRIIISIIFIPLFIIIILSSLLLIGIKSSSFHQFVISKVNETIPGSLTLGSLNISLTGMRFEIRNIELSDPKGKKIAGFKRFSVDASVLGLLKRKVIVKNVILDNPWVVLETDSVGNFTIVSAFYQGQELANDTVEKKEDTITELFPFEIRKLNVNDASAFFKTENDSFKVRADGLSISAKGKTDSLWADVSVALDSALIELSGREICLRNISLMTCINNLEIDTVDLKLDTDNSTVKVSGKAGSLKNDPVVNIGAELELSLAEIDSVIGLGRKLDGSSNLKMTVSGKVSNPDLHLEITCNQGKVWGYHLDSLCLKSHLQDRVLSFKPFHLGVGEGNVDLVGDFNLAGMFPEGFLENTGSIQKLKYRLDILGEDVSIGKLVPSIDGIADMSINLDGMGLHPDSLISSLGVNFNLREFRFDSSFLPINSSVACTVEVSDGKVAVRTVDVGVGAMDETVGLQLNGIYDICTENINADLELSVKSIDNLLKTAKLDSGNGELKLSAFVEGKLRAPVVNVNMNAGCLEFGKTSVGDISLVMKLDSNGNTHLNELILTNDSSLVEISGVASVLNKGVPIPLDQIGFNVSVLSDRLFIDDFIDSVQGNIKINADINGNVNDLTGGIKVNLSDLIAAGQHVPKVDLITRLEHHKAIIEPLLIEIGPEQEIGVNGWVSLKDSLDLRLEVSKINLDELSLLENVNSLSGIFTMNIDAGGTYTDPIADGSIVISNIVSGEKPIDDISLKLKLIDNKLKVAGLVGGNLDAGYDLGTRDFFAKLLLDNLQLEPYLALSGQDLEGAITASLQVAGNIDTLERISGELDLSSLVLYYKEFNVLETYDLSARFNNKRYVVSDFGMKLAEKGQINGRASGFVDGTHDVVVNGIVPLDILRQFSSDLSDVEGRVLIDVVFRGKPEKSDLMADLRLENVGMTLPGISQRLNSINGRIHGDQKGIRIERIAGKLDEGDISLNGELKLDKLEPADLTAEITLNKLPVNVPEMLDVMFDAKLRIAGNPDTTSIQGDIVLLDGLYYQDIDINPFSGMGQRKRKEPVRQEEISIPYLKNMKIDVGIQARSPFRVDNNIAQLTISPDLHLMGTVQAPTLNGRANVDSGSITYLKRVFTVERGVIDFVNPYAIEPQVDIMGKIPIQDRIISIIVSGSPDNMVFKLECDDPGLEDQDIISLLVLGMTTYELQNDFQSGLSSGESNQQMLAALVASTFGEDIRNVTGLDVLEVETGDDDNDNSDRIAVTVGKQLTRRLGTKYTVETESGEVLQRATAEYRILQNLFLAGFQDTKGVFGGELRFTWQKR